MTHSTTVVRFSRHGAPAEVASVESEPLAAPGHAEVRVRMLLAPIHPADLNILEGTYGRLPTLPAIGGNEGVAEITALGEAVFGWSVGERTLIPLGFGAWRTEANLPVSKLRAVPDGLSLEQAAQLQIVPATAWRMLHDFVELKPGDWVVQNAGNSAVGRSVIEIARYFGWKTLSLVRRAEVTDELRAIGADAVVTEGEDKRLSDRLADLTGGVQPRLALNAVGGDSALSIAGTLAPRSAMVTYGGMSRQPVRIPTGFLIFRELELHGFWVTQWYARAEAGAEMAMFSALSDVAATGGLKTQVEATYLLTEAKAALEHAGQCSRKGKIFFRGEGA